MMQFTKLVVVFFAMAIASSTMHAMSSPPRSLEEIEELARELELLLPSDLLAILNDESIDEEVQCEQAASSNKNDASPLILHMPVPQIAQPFVEDPEEDESPCALVLRLEQYAEAEMREARVRRALENQALNKRIEEDFHVFIAEPMRSAIKDWRNTFQGDAKLAYWHMRLLIENHLSLFRQAPQNLIKRLTNIIGKSRLPYSLKTRFIELVNDYRIDYEYYFWKYHYLQNGVVFFWDYLPPKKKPFSKQ